MVTMQPMRVMLVPLLLAITLALASSAPLVHAASPRLLGAEFALRRVDVGTLRQASDQSSHLSPYEVEWTSVELMAIDVVFEQTMFRRVGAGADSSADLGTHHAAANNNATDAALAGMRGAIQLDCGSQGLFALSDEWGGTGGPGVEGGDFWSSPTASLLPLHSARNPLRHELASLLDRRIDAPPMHARPLSPLLGSHAGGSGTESASERPNVLSLLLPLAFADAIHAQRFVEWTPMELQQTPPFAQCVLRYVPAAERANALDGSAPPAALTNFKGFELSSEGVRLVPRRGGLGVGSSRTILRVDPALELHMQQRAEREAQEAKEAAVAEENMPPLWDDDDEQGAGLYASSPLHAQRKTGGSSSSSSSPAASTPAASSKPSAAADADDDDPFANILLDTSAAAGFVSVILRPIAHGVMKPATAGTNDLLLDDLYTVLGNNLFYSVTAETGPDLSLMLGRAVGTQVSNILQDSLTYAITKSIVETLTASVAPYVATRVIRQLPGPLHGIIHAILEKKIPDRLERSMPVILSRVLGLTLTHSLSRSIPHVVVPALALSLGLNHAGSLSRPRAYHEVCMRCYLQATGAMTPVRPAPPELNPDGYDSAGATRGGSECGACPTSTYSMYYTLYTAAHYSDYYSEYYAEYYSQSLQRADEAVYADDGDANLAKTGPPVPPDPSLVLPGEGSGVGAKKGAAGGGAGGAGAGGGAGGPGGAGGDGAGTGGDGAGAGGDGAGAGADGAGGADGGAGGADSGASGAADSPAAETPSDSNSDSSSDAAGGGGGDGGGGFAGGTHTVVKGDTLWGIASKYYCKGSLWPRIHEANRSKIKDPHWIYPGQVFTIPPG